MKGDAHIHTVFSDGGPNTVDDRVRQAIKNNLDFIIITDHVIPSTSTSWAIGCTDKEKIDAYYTACLNANASYSDVITLWRFEWTIDRKPHILAYGLTPHEMEYINIVKNNIQEAITAINNAGGVAFFAHPAWSSATYSDLYVSENLTGFEGFNYGSIESFIEVGKEWDQLLMAGKSLVMIGGSDAHGEEEAGQWGTTFVYCPNATEKGIVEGYKRGCIYFSESNLIGNSWKPIFRIEFTVNETWMGQTISPSSEIDVCTASLWINVTIVEGNSEIDWVTIIQNGEAVRHISGQGSTSIASYLNIPNVKVPSYFRIMAKDIDGKYVASNPVFIGKFAKSGGAVSGMDPRLPIFLFFFLIVPVLIGLVIVIKISVKKSIKGDHLNIRLARNSKIMVLDRC